MKQLTALGALLLLFGTGVIGCSNTSEGVKQDTADNAAKVDKAADRAVVATEKAADTAGAAASKAAENAVDATKDATKNTADALSLTPKVKTAITADETLNNTRNTIDVDSADNVVHLKGTVINAHMKNLAGQIAEKAVKEAGSNDKVSNELKVQAQ